MPEVKWINVEIPIHALTAKDCPPDLRIPAPLPEGSDPPPDEALAIESIVVPEGSPNGCILRVEVDGGVYVDVRLPVTAAGGDALNVVQRPNGTWKAYKRTTAWSLLIPEGAPGQSLTVALPDCTQLALEIPESVKAGQILNLEQSDGAWGIKNAVNMPPAERIPKLVVDATSNGTSIQEPLIECLKLVRERGYLQGAKLDKAGVLHVVVPFCGTFTEYALLGNYLADSASCIPGWSGAANVLATDICDWHSFQWAVASRWYSQVHPSMKLTTCVKDLATDSLPEAGLYISIHPEVTKGGPWFAIVGSIVQACRGLCVFATFYEAEMKTLVNMVNMYKTDSTKVEVVENPYYDGKDTATTEPLMRYLVLVTRA
eukprot:TRINITY_DN19988_c0_g1_i1.p1 TRINITY_DN19988_c0_g1~~TRINITY_DN19988_c0_g1_i1.p1  ORF type:complete len:373 (-),score=69.17 TRINITY_DN19988_c0_g1_i1:139-1257(-)